MISIIDTCQFFGATVQGPLHHHFKVPNQDAWCGQKRHDCVFIVVCDGMGSRTNASEGSKAACIAVKEAIRLWINSSNAPMDFFLRSIKLIWEMKIAPLNPDDCASTCLCAYISANGRLCVVGLGDGIALIRRQDGQLIKVIDRLSDFSNQTKALGQPHKLSDWKMSVFDYFEPGMAVLLATDGISDDLEPGKISELLPWFIEKFGALPPVKRASALRRTLNQWPTPFHQDDKTLALLYRPLIAEEMSHGSR
jgi:serine/threonine protein phosphatase PrpC